MSIESKSSVVASTSLMRTFTLPWLPKAVMLWAGSSMRMWAC